MKKIHFIREPLALPTVVKVAVEPGAVLLLELGVVEVIHFLNLKKNLTQSLVIGHHQNPPPEDPWLVEDFMAVRKKTNGMITSLWLLRQ